MVKVKEIKESSKSCRWVVLVEMDDGLSDGHFGQFFLKISGDGYTMYTRSLSSRFQACQELAGHCFLLALHFVEKNAGVMMLTYKSLVREVSYIC